MRSAIPPGGRVPFELVALSRAWRYQRWIHELAAPYLGESILEIGSGVGNLSRWLPLRRKLILTERDEGLFRWLVETQGKRHRGESRIELRLFDLVRDPIDVFAADDLDTVVSFNVLEHIEDDRLALERQVEILRRSAARGPKHLVCFVPAHPWAYGGFDRALGHHRRYTARRLRELAREVAPEAEVTLRHFNFAGLLGWVVQGRLLGRTAFDARTIGRFERLVPLIRPVDEFLHEVMRLPFGQSLMMVLSWGMCSGSRCAQ